MYLTGNGVYGGVFFCKMIILSSYCGIKFMRINSIAEGEQVIAAANNSVCIGSGAPWLVNNQANTFMAGFNSDAPTMYISSASGAGSTGNVGIGGSGYSGLTTPNPIEKLEVWNGNIRQTSIDLYANPTANSSNSGYNNIGLNTACSFYGFTTDNNSTLTNTIAGVSNSFIQVGLNSNNPEVLWDANQRLDFNIDASVSGCSPTTIVSMNDLTGPYTMYVVGNSYITGGTWIPSDLRYKKNIVKISNSLEKVISLNAVTYQYDAAKFPLKGFTDKHTNGFIAQELIEVVPEAVLIDKEGYHAVNYEIIIPLLADAIKVQQSMIDSLRENKQVSQDVDSVSTSEALGIRMDSVERLLQTEILKNKNTDSIINIQNELIQKYEIVSTNQQEVLIKLRSEIDALKDCLNNLNICGIEGNKSTRLSDTTLRGVVYPELGQNQPNPFNLETRIPYFLPRDVKNAEIHIYNLQGTLIKRYTNLHPGHSELIVSETDLVSGMYLYSLIIENKEYKTLRMIVTGDK